MKCTGNTFIDVASNKMNETPAKMEFRCIGNTFRGVGGDKMNDAAVTCTYVNLIIMLRGFVVFCALPTGFHKHADDTKSKIACVLHIQINAK